MGEERPVEPFSDLHVEEGHGRAAVMVTDGRANQA